tara:strand:- start:338 stop:733 length:396 start_codon:yes stop_codon:yes gene_type:complete
MFCNVGFAEIKHKKIECESKPVDDQYFIEFFEEDKRALVYHFEPKNFKYDVEKLKVKKSIKYIFFYNSSISLPDYGLNRENGRLAIYKKNTRQITSFINCVPIDDIILDIKKYLDGVVDKLKKKQKEKNKF